jgi:hypothetical protein
MSMIDWFSLGFNSIWIFGLGFVTAGLSIASFLKNSQNIRFRQAMKSSICRISIGLGLVMFCIGLAGCVSPLWERLLWVILAAIFLLQALRTGNKSFP